MKGPWRSCGTFHYGHVPQMGRESGSILLVELNFLCCWLEGDGIGFSGGSGIGENDFVVTIGDSYFLLCAYALDKHIPCVTESTHVSQCHFRPGFGEPWCTFE